MSYRLCVNNEYVHGIRRTGRYTQGTYAFAEAVLTCSPTNAYVFETYNEAAHFRDLIIYRKIILPFHDIVERVEIKEIGGIKDGTTFSK